MHNDSTPRGVTRVTKPNYPTRRLAASVLAALLAATTLAACADDSPMQPKAQVPDGGVKAVALGINVLPAGQQFPDKIAFVTGSAWGTVPKVQVYDKWGNQMARFQAFNDAWDQSGPGADVALGDVNGDRWPDILAGEGPTPNSTYGSRFGVWDGRTGVYIGGFSTSTNHRGGLRVGAGDIDGDGRDEIFTCFGPSNQPTRRDVFRVNATNIGYVKSSMTLGFVTGTNTFEGCRVAGGDVTGDKKDEIVVIFDGPQNTLLVEDPSFKYGTFIRKKPFGGTYTGYASLAVADMNGDGKAEVLLGRLAAMDTKPPVRIFDGAALIDNSYLPVPTIVYPMTNSTSATGIHIGARDIDGDGVPEVLAKPTTAYSASQYVALMAPTFTLPWLNRLEQPGNIISGGPIH